VFVCSSFLWGGVVLGGGFFLDRGKLGRGGSGWGVALEGGGVCGGGRVGFWGVGGGGYARSLWRGGRSVVGGGVLGLVVGLKALVCFVGRGGFGFLCLVLVSRLKGSELPDSTSEDRSGTEESIKGRRENEKRPSIRSSWGVKTRPLKRGRNLERGSPENGNVGEREHNGGSGVAK